MGDSIEIRQFEPADIGEVVELLSRCLPADPIPSGVFQRKVLLDQNFDLRGALVARADEQVVGFALGMVRKIRLEDGAPDFDRSWITLIAVDERFRRQGIGTRMVRTLETYFTLNECKYAFVSSYAPNYFIPGVDVNAYPGALEFFKAAGFDEVYRPLSMDASLVGLRTPEWVREKERTLEAEGVVIEPFRPELILPVLDFMKSEFPGDWQRFARETMGRIASGEYCPEHLWTAHEGGRVVGYCQFADDCRFGPFGVSASQRGRGIGAALLFRVLHSMRSAGIHNAWFLWTDDKVAKLYAEAGFTESRRFALLKKAL